MIRPLLLALPVLLAFPFLSAAAVQAAEPCPKGGEAWSAACFAAEGGERRVKPQYLKRLDWNRHGMATIVVADPRELLAVDRSGKVVVPNIRHTGDFDHPGARNGIGRFTVKDAHGREKCGYFAAELFTVVIAPEYDACQAFRENEAQACKDCVSYCTDADCHDRVLVGGSGVALAPDGKVLRTFTPPTLDSVCGTGKATVRQHGPSAILQCPARADSPFRL